MGQHTQTFRAYFTLTKPRISVMQLITVSIGFFLAGILQPLWGLTYIPLLLGSYLAASGAGVLNQWLEIDVDRKMDRTCARPLVTGEIKPLPAFIFGLILIIAGIGIHGMLINPLTAFITSLTVGIYLGIYTPLKRTTWLNTFVGAVPGSLPILGGWAASGHSFTVMAWILFMMMFTWQHPHFFALAISIADDYKKGGLHMLPVLDNGYNRSIRQIVLYTFLMLAISVLPVYLGILGIIYLIGMIIAGGIFLYLVLTLIRWPKKREAKRVFFGSIIYLQVWMIVIIVDRVF